MDWNQWWNQNQARIRAEQSPYAELFALNVLRSVPGINLDFLHAEYDIGYRRADFAIHEGEFVRIVLEVDSDKYHGSNEQIANDNAKDIYLREQGWCVLRFRTHEFGDTPIYNAPPVSNPIGVDACVSKVAEILADRREIKSQHMKKRSLQFALEQQELERRRRRRAKYRIAAIALATAGVAAVIALAIAGEFSGSKQVRLEMISITRTVRAGEKASIAIATDSQTGCTVTYRTPQGAVSNASGLDPKIAGSDGELSWKWTIGSGAKPGAGLVHVNCNGHEQEWTINVTD